MGFLPVLRKKFLHCLNHKFLNFSNGLSSNICNPPNSDKIEFFIRIQIKRVQRKIHLIFPRLDNFWRENGEKNPIFLREKKTDFPDFSPEKM